MNELRQGRVFERAKEWVDRIHVDRGHEMVRSGRRVWVKSRSPAARWIMHGANLFFCAANNPVKALTSRKDWLEWEVRNFSLLHGPNFSAGADAEGTLWLDLLPGISLSSLLDRGLLTPAIITTAATELQRAHGLACSFHQSGWSHGDCHSGNMLYDATSGRTRLIDFEVRHHRCMSADLRHADDLLILLQDICGRCKGDEWPKLAEAVLKSYAPSSEIKSALKSKLRIPSGIPRLWWAIRTTWLPRAELQIRIDTLSQQVD